MKIHIAIAGLAEPLTFGVKADADAHLVHDEIVEMMSEDIGWTCMRLVGEPGFHMPHVRAVWLSDEPEAEEGDGWTYITEDEATWPPDNERRVKAQDHKNGWNQWNPYDDLASTARETIRESIEIYVGDRWRFVDGE